MYKIGFDNEKYLEIQSENIIKRRKEFGGKLYLEFGGKLFDDVHASHVLPGFKLDNKVLLLKSLKEELEIMLVINAADIEQNRIRGDYGITYGEYLIKLIENLKNSNLYVGSVVITQYSNQKSTIAYKLRLEQLKIKVYLHYPIDNYPMNIPLIISEDGLGKNDFVKTEKPLVIVTGPGPGSGKMAACLSQIYHEFQNGTQAGYAKFELFPTWNLPLTHPINLAYEAATVNIKDVNMIDPFHLEAYGISATSYNRDVEGFSVLNEMFKKILGYSPYKSPTDMGVNMAGYCISDDEVCQQASKNEIIRRYYSALCSDRMYGGLKQDVQKLELLMSKAGAAIQDRNVVLHANNKEKVSETPSVAIELPDSRIITGKTTSLLGAASASLLNALKTLAGINEDVLLISPIMIEPIQKLKLGFLGNRNPRLHTDEVLIALSICSVTNPTVKLVLEQLPKLRNSEAHSTVILSQIDMNVFHKLGVNITCEPKYTVKK